MLSPTIAYPQGNVKIEFHHGAEGAARFYKWIDNGVEQRINETQIRRRLPKESQVCFKINDAHPVFYSYTLGTKIDTIKYTVPGVGTAVTALNARFPKELSDALKELSSVDRLYILSTVLSEPKPDISTWWSIYLDRIKVLTDDIDSAQRAASNSEAPEPEAATVSGRSGFRGAQEAVRSQPGSAGRFNDPNLSVTTQQWYDDLKPKIDTLPRDTLLLDILRSHTAGLVKARDAIKKAYLENSPTFNDCVKIGSERTTIRLKIQRREKMDNPPRAVGDSAFTVVIEPYYGRPTLEVVPVAYSVFVRDVAKFDVVDNKVTRELDSESFDPRIGGMLTLNVKEFLDDRAGAFAVGIGSNLFGGGKTLGELFGGVLISWRDLFRIGLGWGEVQVSERLKRPALVDQPLPAGQSLKDVVVEGDKGGWFLIFNIQGLNVPVIR